ncbi:MAG: hypothetical protein SV375_12760 [Thermodesulfobacteriota bacterium]|nr:hypothetical protein [Thermodesulfobacteriota bacterium]
MKEGRMVQVGVDVKPVPQAEAIPKERRNWHEWRRKKIKSLFRKLPENAHKFR